MRRLLGWLDAAATRRPVWTLIGLAVLTAVMATLASGLEVEVDLTELRSEDSPAGRAMDRVEQEFADPGATLQVILDAGPGGNVLTDDGLRAVAAAEDVVLEALGADVRTDDDGAPVVRSLDDAGAVEAIAGNPLLPGLASEDLDVEEGRARATVLIALLDEELSQQERTDAGQRVRDAFATPQDGPLDDVAVTVTSSGLFTAEMLDAIRDEVPRLFGLALLVILAILAFTYRTWFDVAVGFAGLAATVVWTLGLATLLGPGHLGLTGPLSQLVVVIPVLLVGLGIDYAVHLTARYREQRAGGQDPSAAARRAMYTVGAALVLSATATAVGFASLVLAPLQLISDFGVFVAVGIVCAFVILTLLVPAARVMRDRRRPHAEPDAVRELGLAGAMRVPVWLVRRAPAVGLLVALLLSGVSLVAASGLDTRFDRDDFVPEGSDVAALLSYQRELFGGSIDETTFVIVDGDLTDPAVANAVLDAQRQVGEVAGVRTLDGTPQVVSVVSLAEAVLDPEGPAAPPESGPEDPPAPALAEAWDGDGFAADADLDAVYDLLRHTFGDELVDRFLTPDAGSALVELRTTAGDAGAERVRRHVTGAFAGVEDLGAGVAVTSEPIVIAEMSAELSTFQAQAIAVTLAVVLVMLTLYYAVTHRRWLLGSIALLPAAVSAALAVGTMRLLGISFNAVTATMTAIAVGIGVDYGVHVVHRFVEERSAAAPMVAATRTLHATGTALTGSAVTTLGAFVVLSFSGLLPIRSLGLLGGVAIAVALLTGVLAAPGTLVLWARHDDRGRRV